MNMLVDIGNTRIKWCTDIGKGIEKAQAVEHRQADFINHIQLAWGILDTPEILAIASVSKKRIAEQLIELAKTLWPNVSVILAKSSAQGFSVKNAYPQANKLGVDRWLGLIALRHYYPGNSCIVDCGTAITVDVLNQHGQHLGGLISPGLQTMKHSLFKGTEDLSHVDQQYPAGLANFTESAIYSGTLFAAIGLIEKVATDLCSYQTIVLTGGDAELLAQQLEFEVIVEPYFILKGLSLYCLGEVLR
jgi:type III pantothenate kinase